MKNLLLIYGGGGMEHEVSLRSKDFFISKINSEHFNIIEVEITKDGSWFYHQQKAYLNFDKTLVVGEESFQIDLAIPCIHGHPNESGQLPGLFEILQCQHIIGIITLMVKHLNIINDRISHGTEMVQFLKSKLVCLSQEMFVYCVLFRRNHILSVGGCLQMAYSFCQGLRNFDNIEQWRHDQFSFNMIPILH